MIAEESHRPSEQFALCSFLQCVVAHGEQRNQADASVLQSVKHHHLCLVGHAPFCF